VGTGISEFYERSKSDNYRGLHGGGTSYIAKLRRYHGLILRDGKSSHLNREKYHEFPSFRKANEALLVTFGDKRDLKKRPVRTVSWSMFSTCAAGKLRRRINIEGNSPNSLGRYRAEHSVGMEGPAEKNDLPSLGTICPTAKTLVVPKSTRRATCEIPSGRWVREEASPWLRRQYNSARVASRIK